MRIPSVLLAIACLLLANCVSSVARRIARNPQAFDRLSEEQKAAVKHGAITEGMPKEAVLLAWGEPSRKGHGSKDGRAMEHWSYEGVDAVHTTAIGAGVGLGRHAYGYGGWGADPLIYQAPVAVYVPYEAGWVDFAGGKVVAWSDDPH